jgi:hypothetical protein
MNDREKLVELINHVAEGHVENLMQPGGAEALADYLIANGVTVLEWISVADRLPESGQACLVWGNSKMLKKHISYSTFFGAESYFPGSKDHWSRGVKNVSHWLPLPEWPGYGCNQKPDLVPRRNRELAGMTDNAMREKGQLHETIDQLKAQLEAALGELKRAAGENAVCIGCKHYEVSIEDSPVCTECDCECEKCKDPCPCASCERASNWEWDGGEK